MHFKSLRYLLVVFCSFCFFQAQTFAADSNGIKEGGIYNITIKVGGTEYAWTHIADGKPTGTSPSKEKVELRPFKKEDKAQQWKIKSEIAGKSIYHLFSTVSENPWAPICVYKINGKFANDGDDSFHEENNRISVTTNQSDIDRAWHLVKKSNGKYLIQPMIGMKEHQKAERLDLYFEDERVVEAVSTKKLGVRLRHRKPSDSQFQQWTLAPVH
jgi:hypothetical protein